MTHKQLILLTVALLLLVACQSAFPTPAAATALAASTDAPVTPAAALSADTSASPTSTALQAEPSPAPIGNTGDRALALIPANIPLMEDYDPDSLIAGAGFQRDLVVQYSTMSGATWQDIVGFYTQALPERGWTIMPPSPLVATPQPADARKNRYDWTVLHAKKTDCGSGSSCAAMWRGTRVGL